LVRVALALSASAVAVQGNDASNQGFVDGVQSTHDVQPFAQRALPVVDLVNDIHMEAFAGFLVIDVIRHG
jgi:hypothetical protein